MGFVRKYPRVQLDLIITSRRVNLVEEGVDLALRSGTLADSTLVARKVAVSELGLYAAPAYLRARGRPRRLTDLAAHDCIVYRSQGELMPWRLMGPRGIEQVSVSGPITADDLGTVKSLTLAGLGISLFPDILVRAEEKSGKLERLLPSLCRARGGDLRRLTALAPRSQPGDAAARSPAGRDGTPPARHVLRRQRGGGEGCGCHAGADQSRRTPMTRSRIGSRSWPGARATCTSTRWLDPSARPVVTSTMV